ncbi:hypothetical protein [Flagellimonas marinaquae]|uniref:hypothetical protein n=1 Tax=Flagellimonas marinaquae TaxID=254955 RepID=UPI002075A1C0|nr:hypothetical protein [Allomuricauda aquimarina]USD24060.1 hypothetical protein MJO53_10235 [Allomuricauda aquimarina]
MVNSNKECFKILRKEGDIQLSESDLDLIISIINIFKNECYDNSGYEWRLKPYQNFVRKNNLSFRNCHKVLQVLSNDFGHLVGGENGFKKFVNEVEKYSDEPRKVQIARDDEYEFLRDLKKLRKDYFKDYPVGKFIKLIHENFQIGDNHTLETIRRKYYSKP